MWEGRPLCSLRRRRSAFLTHVRLPPLPSLSSPACSPVCVEGDCGCVVCSVCTEPACRLCVRVFFAFCVHMFVCVFCKLLSMYVCARVCRCPCVCWCAFCRQCVSVSPVACAPTNVPLPTLFRLLTQHKPWLAPCGMCVCCGTEWSVHVVGQRVCVLGSTRGLAGNVCVRKRG